MKRSDGRLRGRIQYDGIAYDFYGDDPKELEKEMADRRYELEHGIYEKENRITVDKWFDIWINEYKKPSVKFGTIQSYQRIYDLYLKRYIGRQRLTEVRPDQLQTYLNRLGEKRSKETIGLVVIVLNGMYKQAMRNGLVQKNPAAMLVKPKGKKSSYVFRVLTVEEQKLFLQRSKESLYHEAYVTMLGTGMRSGEIRALQWKDVDLEQKVIHITGTLKYHGNKLYQIDDPKTKTSARDIPILPEVMTALTAERRKKAERRLEAGTLWKPGEGFEDLVFTNSFGSYISNSALNVDINRIVDAIRADGQEMENVKPHTFRHTFATRGLERGIPPKVMQELLGHSSIVMTLDIYSHVLPSTKAEEIKKLSGMFA